MHPRTVHVLDHPLDDYPVFLADSKKFISYWKEKLRMTRANRLVAYFTKGNSIDYRHNSDDIELLSSTLQESLSRSVPIEMPLGVGFDFENRISFGNGRHRTVNLANMGAPYIPMQVHQKCMKDFHKLFYWDGH